MESTLWLAVLRLGCLICLALTSGYGGSGIVSGSTLSDSTTICLRASCLPLNVHAWHISKYSATVTRPGRNFGAMVVWSSSDGNIDGKGNHESPAFRATMPVTGTSKHDPKKRQAATIAIQPVPAIAAVSVSCVPPTILGDQISQCSANVEGRGNFNSGVSWTVQAPGAISSSGLLTSPGVTSATLFIVTATSMADSSKSGSATVTINPFAPPAHLRGVGSETSAHSKAVIGILFLCFAIVSLYLYYRPTQISATLKKKLDSFDNLFPPPAGASEAECEHRELPETDNAGSKVDEDDRWITRISSASRALVFACADAKSDVTFLHPGKAGLEEIQKRQRRLQEEAATAIEELSKKFTKSRRDTSRTQYQQNISHCAQLVSVAEQAVASTFMRVWHYEAIRTFIVAVMALAVSVALLLET